MSLHNLETIVKVIQKASRAVILPHVSADGDAVGSALALHSALTRLGLDSVIYLEEQVPAIYSFLPGTDTVQVYGSQAIEFDLAIALDTGDRGRLGKRIEVFDQAGVKVNIDHHSTNTSFAMYNFVDTKASAVGEIVYRIIEMLGLEPDGDIATCLYAAITTDTGGFRFSNTTSETHRITAELISRGVDVAAVSRKVFDTVSLEKAKLMGQAIGAIELFENGQAAMIVLTDEMMQKSGASEEDCDGIVNIARNISGVEVAFMLRSRSDGTIKGNLRSQERVDVSAIAKAFGGGGHIRAAGFTSRLPIDQLTAQIAEKIAVSLKSLG